MKKLSKNTFAKLFATFLGASTILTPLITIVSCQPISKSPTIEQQNSNKNQNGSNNQNQNNGQTGGSTSGGQTGGNTGGGQNNGSTGGGQNNGSTGGGQNSGSTGEEQNGGGTETTETPKPNTNETQIGSTIDNTAIIVKNNNSGEYSIKGSIYIDNIGKLEAELDSLTGLNGKTINTSGLNIDCFETKKEQISGQSISLREAVNTATKNYTPKTITPDILKKVLELKKSRNFTTLTLNNNGTISIPFESNKTDYFDITDLAKFSFSEGFKLTENSVIFLRAERELDMPGTEDNTKYAKTTELLSLVNNPKIKHKITVGKVQLRGNVKDLLPLLVGPNKIKEADGGITFGKAFDTPCTGENWTGYNGIIVNDNGNINNTGRSILKAEEFLELKKRSGEKQTYVRNAIITDLDSKNMSPEQLADAQFDHDMLTNVNFKNCDLSKIEMCFVAGHGNLKFEDTILPYNMGNSAIGHLILKNATLPEELKTTQLKDILSGFPSEIGTLKIYNLQGKFLDKYTEEEIKQVKKQWQNYGNVPGDVPSRYAGPQDVWNKLKLLLQEGKTTKTHFTNEDLTDVDDKDINFSSIQKPQDTFLALIGKNNSRG